MKLCQGKFRSDIKKGSSLRGRWVTGTGSPWKFKKHLKDALSNTV